LEVALVQGVTTTARAGHRNRWKRAGVILLTVAFIIAPFGTLVFVFYGVRRLYIQRRRRSGANSYTAIQPELV
jgi:hypothetical protein